MLQYGSLAGPFGPVVDGTFLTDTPKRLRDAGKFMRIKVIAGVTRDAGAYYASKSKSCLCILTYIVNYIIYSLYSKLYYLFM